jgi:hypothetical protein
MGFSYLVITVGSTDMPGRNIWVFWPGSKTIFTGTRW